jgi:hypothetical protein
MNGGKFDGGQLSDKERSLRDFYQRLLTFTSTSKALTGNYAEIHSANLNATPNYPNNVFSFVRWSGDEKLIVVSNFDANNAAAFDLQIPASVISQWQLPDGSYKVVDQLYGATHNLTVTDGIGSLAIALQPLESFVYSVGG